ncbi:hypothetical protein WBP07_03800 [Novosphingobium sp. BL-8A]|uniref:hypothetical protein n=1 Tax=Novosphingobium sp. BL-8A TaxID=3127639 RepID=UPI003758269C
MLADVTIDGRTESQFRLAIEAMLREGGADEAARILKSELAWLAGDDHPLPGQFRAIAAEDLEVTGWESLIERIGELDGPGDPITAIGVDVCGMQAGLGATPVLAFETTYYTDQAWGFSHADRAGIGAGYQGTTNAWQGAFEDIDDTLRVAGLDDLNAVIAALETHCRSGEATVEERQAFVVGACYLAVLIHQAVRNKAVSDGLPRPMAVLVGSNEAYPWFEAPAVTARDGRDFFAAHQPSTIEQAMRRSATPPISFGQEAAPRRPIDLGAHPSEMPKPLFEVERAPFAPPSSFSPAPLAPAPLASAPQNSGPLNLSAANPLPLNPESPFAPLAPAPTFAEYSDSEDDEDEGDDAPAPTYIQFPDAPYADAGGWEDEVEAIEAAETPFENEPEQDLDPQDYAPLNAVHSPPQPAPVEEEEALHLPPPGIHVTGTQLRRRFVDRETIVIEEERRPGLLERLFRRR